MQYIITETDSDNVILYFNGSLFVPDMAEAHISKSIEDARYLQGLYQTRHPFAEVAKVAVKATLTLS